MSILDSLLSGGLPRDLWDFDRSANCAASDACATRDDPIGRPDRATRAIPVDQNANPSAAREAAPRLVMEHFPLDDAGESELARGSRSGQGPHEAKPPAPEVFSLLPAVLLLLRIFFLCIQFRGFSEILMVA